MAASEREVVALVRAARRVASIRLRWPTDAHMEQPMGELAQALKAVDIEEPPCNTVPSSGGARHGAPGGSSAFATHNPTRDDQRPEGWQASISGRGDVGAGNQAMATGRSGGAATPPASDPPCARPGCGHVQRMHTCWGECHVERYVPDDDPGIEGCSVACQEFVAPDVASLPAGLSPAPLPATTVPPEPAPDGHAGGGAPAHRFVAERCPHVLVVNGRCDACRWFVERHEETTLVYTAYSSPVPQADGHAQPLLPDYVTPLRALAREVLEETCEESAARHHVDVPSVAKPLLALPRDVHRGRE